MTMIPARLPPVYFSIDGKVLTVTDANRRHVGRQGRSRTGQCARVVARRLLATRQLEAEGRSTRGLRALRDAGCWHEDIRMLAEDGPAVVLLQAAPRFLCSPLWQMRYDRRCHRGPGSAIDAVLTMPYSPTPKADIMRRCEPRIMFVVAHTAFSR